MAIEIERLYGVHRASRDSNNQGDFALHKGDLFGAKDKGNVCYLPG